MSNLIRWEPMREMMTLREAMDRLFDDAFTHPVQPSGVTSPPAIDVYQNDDEVIVRASLPGLDSDAVQISVTDDLLTLRGDFTEENQDKGVNYHIRERRFGNFERTVRLPSEVQTDKAKAEFEKGLLTIVLPKAESVKPKTITIKAK